MLCGNLLRFVNKLTHIYQSLYIEQYKLQNPVLIKSALTPTIEGLFDKTNLHLVYK